MYPLTELKTYKDLKHIVYVDDDEDDRALFSEVLRHQYSNITLSVFENGYDCIALLRSIKNHNQLPCSIICDMKMPLVSGVDLLKIVKREPAWQHIPVVIFSTSSNNPDVLISKDSGATAFFSKPNSLKELRLTISEILSLCSKTISVKI